MFGCCCGSDSTVATVALGVDNDDDVDDSDGGKMITVTSIRMKIRWTGTEVTQTAVMTMTIMLVLFSMIKAVVVVLARSSRGFPEMRVLVHYYWVHEAQELFPAGWKETERCPVFGLETGNLSPKPREESMSATGHDSRGSRPARTAAARATHVRHATQLNVQATVQLP